MGMSAREAALEVLIRCRRDGSWSGAAIDSILRRSNLDRRDSALVSRLCLGVLQNDRYLDYVIDCHARGRLDPRIRDLLRLGAFQILLMDKIPDSAAVNESVELCRRIGEPRAAGLVNAVLRRIAEAKEPLPSVEEKDPLRAMGIRWSHPDWLVRELAEQIAPEQTEEFLRRNARPQPLSIQVNTLKVSVRDYERALERSEIEFERYPGLPGCLRLSGGVVTELPGYEEGLFYVQDPAARMAVAVSGARPGMRVLDACCAPGGKSFAAAVQMEDRGEILACELHEKKLGRVRSGAERLGIHILSTLARDARDLPEAEEGSYDLVLADVPCSGLGVIGKRPEIRRKTKEEISGLPEIQSAILESLARAVCPGGTLLYSTCTVLKQENEDRVLAFLGGHPEFEPVPFSVGTARAKNGMYTFWPQIDGTDGFFAAKLKRKES